MILLFGLKKKKKLVYLMSSLIQHRKVGKQGSRCWVHIRIQQGAFKTFCCPDPFTWNVWGWLFGWILGVAEIKSPSPPPKSGYLVQGNWVSPWVDREPLLEGTHWPSAFVKAGKLNICVYFEFLYQSNIDVFIQLPLKSKSL